MKYKVVCEGRLQYNVFVDADSAADAEAKAAEKVVKGRIKRRMDLYDIVSVERLGRGHE